ncbi:hypothetical protein [Photobacterium sanguinicancri]|uniref:hypothetical protein n=1 Tax=Photobacterium sanguinicancri TaxID=875932 RepID=UPI0026E48CDD|nr:hypothetical protein [Photobacterium sanguinicancri]MDO6498887.1 hypothetical protein [Photobacterium sanguinicancri]
MRPAILKELSLLRKALSPEYYDYFLNSIPTNQPERKKRLITNIYASFVFLTKPARYAAVDILNRDICFNNHFELLVGFIYQESQSTSVSKYNYLRILKTTFKTISTDKQLHFDDLKLSTKEVSVDAQRCINSFNKLNSAREKLNYLNGWQVNSKSEREFELHLNSIFIAYGAEFTQEVHNALINYAHTQKSTTLQTNIGYLKAFFEAMTQACPNSNVIRNHLSSPQVQGFFHNIMNVWFALHLANGNDPKSFFPYWRAVVGVYTECFIDSRTFDAPIKPFIAPDWKSPQKTAPIFSVGGQATEKEKKRWFAEIPLKIKDEEAVTIIKSKIDKDLAHIRHVCMAKFKELQEIHERNTAFIQSGGIKPLTGTQHDHNYRGFVGEKNIVNTVATFYAHGIGLNVYEYNEFLGFNGKNNLLLKELNLPTTSALAVLSTLLVLEHPQMTPSWFAKWELFDKNGKQVGFKKSNKQYIAVSCKERKGTANAEQLIVLNDFSRQIVEFLIQYTAFARAHLKVNGKTKWRKMLLTASVTNAKPVKSIKNLNNSRQYLEWLSDPSLFEPNCSMDQYDAIKLANLTTLRSVRKHRGLQIYLETRSMTAVAEALGHKKKDLSLLTSYLPEPLMDFFNDRWVRQFQSAILLEAMKDSKYKLDAVNMTTEDIEEFLTNHGLGSLPHHLDHDFQVQSEVSHSNKSSFDEMTFMISSALLQLLIAIRTVVENHNGECEFLGIVNGWYQSAVFVLNSLSTEQYCSDVELAHMFHEANENALDINLLKGALTC